MMSVRERIYRFNRKPQQPVQYSIVSTYATTPVPLELTAFNPNTHAQGKHCSGAWQEIHNSIEDQS